MLLVISALIIQGLLATDNFENNGYKNVIVSIHPDILDDNGQDIIDNIKVHTYIQLILLL